MKKILSKKIFFLSFLLSAYNCKTQTSAPITTVAYNYTGASQTFTVPQACISSISITCYGSCGAAFNSNLGGGPGSMIQGVVSVTPGTVLYIYCGGNTTLFNGNGTAGNGAGIGGGATDVRFGGTSLANRIIVAGGGGGQGGNGANSSNSFIYSGGNGGGVNGTAGQNSPSGTAGSGATGTLGGIAGVGCSSFVATAGGSGSLGHGGNGGYAYLNLAKGGHGGGGGGGYFGGGGGGAGATSNTSCIASEGGGGGGGAAGTSYVSSAFSNTLFSQNGNYFSGYVIIKYTTNNFSTTVNSTSTLTCNGSPVILTAYSAAGNYTWSSGAHTPSITVSPTIGTLYTVTTSLSNGSSCSSTASLYIAANSSPALSVSVSSNSVCPGNTVTLLASGAMSYSWSDGISNGVAFTPTTNSVYTVTSQNNCGTSTASVAIGILQQPTLSILADTVICSGSTSVFSVSGASSYVWSNSSTSNTINVSPLADVCYSVIGTAVNGCTNSASQCVKVLPIPTLVVSGSNSVCLGSSANFSATGALTYTWLPSGSFAGSNSSAVTITPSSNANYTVIGTNSFGCTSQTVISIIIGSATSPIVITSSPGNTVCAGQSIILTAGNAQNCNWINSSNTTTLTTPSIYINPTVNTVYSVTATNIDGCRTSSSIDVIVNTCTGILGIGANPAGISIYPNPSEGRVSIVSATDMELYIIDQLGEKIKTIQLNRQNNFTWMLDDLENGIYFIYGKNEIASWTKKIIVAK